MKYFSPCFLKGDFLMKKDRFGIRSIVMIGILSALAYVIELVFHIKVAFLTFDLKDFIVCISSMLFGPVFGVVISAVTALLEMITISDTSFWGALMNFVSTAVFASTAGIIYKYYRKLPGAVIGLAASVTLGTAVMLLLDILVVPIYTGSSTGDVIAAIPKLLLPFNLLKYTTAAALVLIFYKPFSILLKRAGVVEKSENEQPYRLNAKTVAVIAVAAAVCAVSVFIMIRFMNGRIGLFGQ